jgi:hypothetical protein
MQFFCGEQWEAIGQVKAHLMTEHPDGARPRPISAYFALGQDAVEQVEIWLHKTSSTRGLTWSPPVGIPN